MNIEILRSAMGETPKDPKKEEAPTGMLSNLKAQLSDPTKPKEKIDPSKSLFLNMPEDDLNKVRRLGEILLFEEKKLEPNFYPKTDEEMQQVKDSLKTRMESPFSMTYHLKYMAVEDAGFPKEIRNQALYDWLEESHWAELQYGIVVSLQKRGTALLERLQTGVRNTEKEKQKADPDVKKMIEDLEALLSQQLVDRVDRTIGDVQAKNANYKRPSTGKMFGLQIPLDVLDKINGRVPETQ